MRRLISRKIAPAVLILGLVSCFAFGQDEWQFQPGILLTSGDHLHTFEDGCGEVVSINGWRRVSRVKLDDVSIYHVLILHPKGPLIGQGSGFSDKGPASTENISWTVQMNPPNDFKTGEKHSLAITYNAISDTVTVENNAFHLSKGNLFIVRMDKSWVPIVSQISAHFNKQGSPQRILKFFKSRLRHDETIQRLKLS
jgi:hypothetical protein